jgi:hypothetical protein
MTSNTLKALFDVHATLLKAGWGEVKDELPDEPTVMVPTRARVVGGQGVVKKHAEEEELSSVWAPGELEEHPPR